MNNDITNRQLPRLSVIVPSYNQGAYLEETLLSVINQNYPNLELIVIDGGSTDNSVDIIRKYEYQIAYWVSEKDRGQSHAINKGIQKATGEWLSMLNSDDCYMPGALHYIFGEIPYHKYDFLHGNCFGGETIKNSLEYRYPSKEKESLFKLLLFFYDAPHIIPSQSVFIRKKIVDEVGALNEDLHYCMDLDYYCRIALTTAKRFFYEKTICFYRFNEFTKSGSLPHLVRAESLDIAVSYQDYLSKKEKKELLKKLEFINGLQKIWDQRVSAGFPYLFRLFKIAPNIAIKDKRFLGFVKINLTRHLKFWHKQP